MNKTDLTNELSKRFKFTKTQSREIINFLIDTIKFNVKNGEQITLNGFGTFYKKEPREIIIYNPTLKKKIKTSVSSKLGFKSKRPL